MSKDSKVVPIKPLFSLQEVEEIKIRRVVVIEGARYELVHVFREPTAEDKKEYQRRLNRTEGIGAERRIILDLGESAEFLWDACIKKVEGYDVTGVKDWKDRVPLEHKQWAVDALLSQAGRLEGGFQKN